MNTRLVQSMAVMSAMLVAGAHTSAWADNKAKKHIENAASAAPAAVGRHATVVMMDEQGQTVTLRQGTNNFTCMPDDPATPANDPMCLDQNGMEWAKAWMGKTTPPAGKIGFGYMLQGGGTASNTDPYATKPAMGRKHLKEGPHVMIFNYGAGMQGYADPGEDADTSQPWVMWSGTPYEHLMIPVK